MIKKILLLFSLVLVNLTAFSGSWLRYNIAGYDPVRPKKVIVMGDANCQGFAWTLKNASNATVASGSLAARVTANGAYMPKAYNHEIDFTSVTTVGSYTLTVTGVGTATIRIVCRPYQQYLSQILRTIRVRRSASYDALDHGYSHSGDASCRIRRRGANNSTWTNSSPAKYADMLGGFYDAGDYIKFTQTNAYLTYFMLRSYESAPELWDGVKLHSTTSLDDLLDECKWGLDFLLKTMPADGSEFIIQTGGSADHNQGLRLPEDDALNGTRECYSSFSRTQMGLTVAALALGSQIFNAKGLTAEATVYKNKAIQIYTAAKASTSTPAWWEGGGEVFYADNELNDNMELAATELYRLTNTASYLTDAQTYGNAAATAGWSSWAEVNLTAHLRLLPYYASIQTHITGDLNSFQTNANLANNRWRIPHASVWGSLYSQFSVAHAALQYKVQGNSTYENIGYDVVDYTFGRNNWGLGFIATQSMSPSITTSYAGIYKVAGTFPYGEIAEGPAPQSEHVDNEPYFDPVHDGTLWHSGFNTTDFTFFEQAGDYVCMETTIGGLADGLYLMTLATKGFCSSPLPVQIIQFDAEFSKGHVNLQWSTAQEVDNNYFSIERSSDGMIFYRIGTVSGNGTIFEISNYSFVDNDPLDGVSYYRIVQHDTDGNSHQVPAVAVKNFKNELLEVFPNPFKEFFFVNVKYNDVVPLQFKLKDLTGKIVFESEGVTGHNTIDPGEGLAEGFYILEVYQNNRIDKFKIIKNLIEYE